ncbi:MAG: PrgI family protein [Candidatus Nanosyncoccus sp. P13S_S20_bin.18.1]|nr:PrgI family protein [Candidatus Nanosyncoccus sp. P13S_S20_bin.18.1]
MATYKVPQDVEAEDRLLGPFTFRQFVYLLIAAIAGALAAALFQIFPLLAILPLPVIIFFLILALPLKKDQPMETYLAAIVSFYMKPNKRFWRPGQGETTIQITAPKIVEKSRTRDISEEEASHRLSFLSNLVDSEGYAIRGNHNGNFTENFIADTEDVNDFMDDSQNQNLINLMQKEKVARHAEIINQMKAAINNTENAVGPATISSHQATLGSNPFSQNQTTQNPFVQNQTIPNQTIQNPSIQSANTLTNRNQSILNSNYQNLANNQNFSINTISKEANRYRENLAPNAAPQTFVTQTPYTPNFTQPPTTPPNINQNPFIQH